MSDSSQSGPFSELFALLYQLLFVVVLGVAVVETAFHPKDPLVFALLVPIGIAIYFGVIWFVTVAAKILEAAFAAVKERWRRRQRGW